MATGARSVVAAGDIGLVVTGDANQFQVVASPQRVATSNYRYQVESLAAAEFCGRSQELALMAEFCTAREDADNAEGAYWRWLAPAWAGKTALDQPSLLFDSCGDPRISEVGRELDSRLAQLIALLGGDVPRQLRAGQGTRTGAPR